ncbi:uncharacterized protein B0H18DRAFT_1122581 [Fomitopsis serialis]|uniref:uncharacterized protein n=1 Tax=Fomitopsis serialis TaxID=139415 RepID=UPI0020079463|nr:uncharacterized protein B0H18DRAFT_1122581 [Neoantrodia serialis]KAH9919329.1 hypothetical protein B0H18DRAFT_1122581 [Neoantrodia serialis]
MDEGLVGTAGKFERTHGITANAADGVHIASTTPGSNGQYLTRESALQIISEEPYGPYFSLPRDPSTDSPSAGLSRRGTTKELIGRFESMSPTKAPSGHRLETPSLRPGAYPAIEKTNKRSPIRQSIRSFLSVFKKSTGKTAGELSTVAGRVGGQVLQERINSSRISVSTSRDRPSTLSVPRVSELEIRGPLNICKTPISPTTARHSGPVLYLSRPPTSSAGLHPVWTHCTAMLHSTHLLLTSETSGGHPSTNIIAFRECADVRSLSSTELDPSERAMLPSQSAEGGDRQVWKIFELQFEGRPREKLAVRSVGERAAWVSKIWDAILEAQEERSEAASIAVRRTQSVMAASNGAENTTGTDPRSAASGRSSAMSARSTITAGSTLNVDRALPDIPQASEKPSAPKLSIQIPSSSIRPLTSSGAPKLSPLPRPPTTPSKTPTTPTRSQSPSIMNLDKRSMVRQRLAQLENPTGSPSPVRGSPLSAASPTASRARSLRYGPDSSGLHRQATSASGVMDSLVDSYRDTPIDSPLSACSGRLTSVAPSSPARTPATSTFLKPPPLAQDLFSPASRYSSDDEVAPSEGGVPSTARRPMIRLDTDAGSMKTPVAVREERGISHTVTLRTNQDVAPDSSDDLNSDTQPADYGALGEIQSKVNAILDQVSRQGRASATDAIDLSSVFTKLDELRLEIQSGAHGTTQSPTGLASSDKLNEMHMKLEALATLCQNLHDREPSAGQPTGDNGEAAEILSLLQGAQEQWSSHTEQQTDSIRYLNELNSVVARGFVNHGTSQIENVAAGIQMLCKELGPGSLLADVRKLLVEAKGKEEGSVALHAAVNGLIAAVHEDLKKNAEARNMLTTESVVGLIDRQRQDQERMLRSLGTELSNEIRGERLRFVEAMKEATQINVQMHVEHFKKELTREVMLMTQEVSRLQRERQGLEQQIGDLFAFYSKQKQAGAQLFPPQQQSRTQHHGRSRSAGPPTPGAQPLPVPGPPGPVW